MKGFIFMLMSMLMFCALTLSTNTVRGADVSETGFITTIVEADTPMAVQTYDIEKENVVGFTQPLAVLTSYESVIAYDTEVSNPKGSLEDVENYCSQEVFGTYFISVYNYDVEYNFNFVPSIDNYYDECEVVAICPICALDIVI